MIQSCENCGKGDAACKCDPMILKRLENIKRNEKKMAELNELFKPQLETLSRVQSKMQPEVMRKSKPIKGEFCQQ